MGEGFGQSVCAAHGCWQKHIFSPFLLVSFNSKPLKGLHVLLRAMVFEAKQKTKNSIKRL